MRLFIFLALMGLPVQAMALSCMRPSVERTFNEIHAAAEEYIAVEGRLTLNTRKLPRSHSNNQRPPELTRIRAKLSGTSLSHAGFKVPFDREITLNVSCFGPWCGSAQNGEQVLAFLKRQNGGYSLDINPCGGHVFSNPRPAMLKKVTRCMRRGNC